MMTTLGNKKNVKIFSFALAGVFIASVAAMAVVSMGIQRMLLRPLTSASLTREK